MNSPSSGSAWVEIQGSQNKDSTGDRLESQTWTWDEENVTFDWSISGYISLDCTVRALDIIGCMFGYCIHLGH